MKLLLIPLLFLATVSSYKILFYTNLFGHSHVKFLAAAADTLTDAGHNVTVLMPVFDTKMKTSLKSTKNTIFVQPVEEVLQFDAIRKKFMANLWLTDGGNPLAMIGRAGAISKTFSAQCKRMLSDTELIEKIKKEEFDLAVTEPFDTCAYAFFEAINIRAHVAVLSSSRLDHVSDVIGLPAALSYNPGTLSTHGDRMTMWERFMNAVQYATGSYFFGYIGDADAKVAREINPSWRSWRQTVPESSFIFANQIPLLDFPAPTFDKIVPIGGISVKTDKKSLKLEEKWSKILDVRQKNVFISFGSNAKSVDMPEQFKKSLLQVFRSMPDTTFIWKYEDLTDNLVDGIENVYLGDWLPQNELLGDPRLNLFLTHGGLGSTTELAMMGKSALMVPLFADQTRNAEMLKRHGGALVLTKNDLADAKLVQETIEKILADENYLKNAQRLAEMLNNQPTSPQETFVKHAEFAARFGKLPSLDNYGRHQSLIVYYFLDIIALISSIVVLSVYISFKLVTCLIRKIRGGKSKTD